MFTKEPQETSDFQIDWSDWLGELTISSSTWTAPSGITIDEDDFTNTLTRLRVSDGEWGQVYEPENTITASNGESETRSLLISIQRFVQYVSSSEVRRRAGPKSGAGTSATISALPNDELDALIEQASRMFDQLCGVPSGYFNPVAIPIPTSKTIYGTGTNYLPLPPYVAGSLDTEISLPSDYTVPTYTEINGHLVINSNGKLPPFTFHHCEGWYSGVAVTVTAIWGFRETPAEVKLAVIELVINLWRETDPANIKLVNLEGQPLREKAPPRVIEIARRLRVTKGAFV